MLYVGIDVAKNKHDMAVVDSSGTILTKHFSFTNNRKGFTAFHIQLQHLIKETNEDIQIALEDTGHYSFNLLAFLRSNGYQVYSYNPLLIKEFAKSMSLRKTKTDKKDALTIARKLLSDFAPERFVSDANLQELKFLTRHRNRLSKKSSDLKVQYTRILDILFPELASMINTHNQCVYELLKQYPSPTKIRRARITSISKIKYLKSDVAIQIQEKAKETIGISSSSLELELIQVIEMIEHYNNQIKRVDKEIEQLMTEIDSPITTMTGIGSRLGSVILAEIRNIHNFKNPAQLQAFAGLEPSIHQSGQIDSAGKMVKRGSPHLRWALLQAARLAAIYSPKLRSYCQQKVSQGKHYNVAISHVAKKLIRIIFYLLKYNQPFDETRLV